MFLTKVNFEYLNNKTLNFRKELPIVILVYVISALYIFIMGLDIWGPFIMMDEFTYFESAQFIAGKSDFISNVVNPLYSIITSISFLSNNNISAYWLTRIINILIFSAVCFPLYSFSREFFAPKIIGNDPGVLSKPCI